MPTDSTPKPARRTPKSSRNPTRSSPKAQHVDSVRPTSLYEPNSVQARIQQWQAQGAADALAPDAVSVRSMPVSECPSNTTRPRSEYGDEFKIRVGGRNKDKDQGTQEKERSQSTPRRRIISDSHWKSQADVKDKGSKAESRKQPESRRYDPSYTSNPEKPRVRRRSRREQSIAREPEFTSAAFDDDIRVTALEDDAAARSDTLAPAYDADSRVDDDLARHLTTESIYSGDFDRRSSVSIQPEDDEHTPRKPSKYAELLGRNNDAVPPPELPRTKRGKLLGKTRDMFMKSENVPKVSNRIPSIEAWLEEQPDPFVDEANVEELPPVEVPKPLRKRTHRKNSSEVKPAPADPNQIWDSIISKVEPRSPPTTRNDEPILSSSGGRNSTPRLRTPRNAEHAESDGSPTSLQRRGARVRRQRERSQRDTTSGDLPEISTPPTEDLQSLDAPTSEASPPPLRRSCPPTGARPLSTIASIETFKELNQAPQPQDEAPHSHVDLKRRLTTHEDLMSVLSMPRGSRARRSARIARGSKAKRFLGSTEEVLSGLKADEQKYGRELQTLVDGVIPVLLQCALSKTDSNAAASLFTSATESDGLSMTKPIIDMGIALERLKSSHRRIPLDDVNALLSWAKTSEKAYKEYLQSWRLGFEDVVVNLAPKDSSATIDPGASKDEAGDLLDGEGKTADVAYLLKRPLVRVKALSKIFGQVRDQSDIPLATQMAEAYADLTALARRRNQEEQARLEDELAAGIDATRTRDIRTMAPTTQVKVNKTRRVKARDFFNLTVYHSSGQRLDCGVELVFRDNARGDAAGGDVLICEVDDSDKWLLFTPVELSYISARRGEDGFDLVVMVRGWGGGLGKEWHELLALKTEDKDAVTEWMTMLGSNPLPPRLNHTHDFAQPPAPLAITARGESTPSKSKSAVTLQNLSKGDKLAPPDVPIGEPSVLGARSEASRRSESSIPLVHKPSPGLSLGGGLASKPLPSYQLPSRPVTRRPVPSVVSSDRSSISDRSIRDTSTILTTSSSSKTASTLLSSVASQAKHFESLVPTRQQPVPQAFREKKSQAQGIETRGSSEPLKREALVTPPQAHQTSKLAPQQPQNSTGRAGSKLSSPGAISPPPAQRPTYQRALSSTPSRDLPTVSKVRSHADQPSPSQTHTPLLSTDTRSPKEDHRPQLQNRGQRSSKRNQIYTEDIPTPPAHNQRQHPPLRPSLGATSAPPATPPHRSNVLQSISSNKASPVLKPTPSPSERTPKRRGSSPLKHEYAPSTTSESSSNYDSDSESDSSSDTSEEFLSEHGDVPTPLVAVTSGDRRSSKPQVQVPVPPSMPPSSYQTPGTSTGSRSLAPSDSASQGPYRKVPSSSTFPANKKSRTIALICAWSDRGMWEQIHPDECSIVISPGLIEAFEMSANHSKPLHQRSDDSESRTSSLSQQPLVAFELTPIVPLRRGTALDISIRSPPTAASKIRTTNNVMFRSRNPEECEALYGMINWARCNNPTYMQLQAARPHRQPSVTFNVGQNQYSRAKSSSWFSFGSQKEPSYRASSAPTPASVDMSVESSGTMTSTFSALKRLGVSNAFNLNRSSVFRKEGGRGGTGASLYSSSSGTRTGSGSSTPAASQAGFIPGKDGPNVPSTSAAAADGGGMVNNMKIRLYVRKGQHWDNLGAARLTVLPASPPESGQTTPRQSLSQQQAGLVPGTSPPATPNHSRSPSTHTPPGTARGPRLPSSNHTPHRVHGHGREKRILITSNKDHNAVLLDQVLGESCFERVMQTGVAVKVWSEDDVIGHQGGVLLGRERIYMMQFSGAREAGWVFGLVGMYRYGGGNGGGTAVMDG